MYSKALKHKDDPVDESGEEVYLWQLYSNRSAVRSKLGKFQKALQDAHKLFI